MTKALKKISSKPYELTVEKRPHYLYARVDSDRPQPEIAVKYLREITEKCRLSRCNKVIIENEIPQVFDVSTILFVATQFPRFGAQLTKVAVVDKRIDQYNRSEFLVMVGRKPGLDVHVFYSVKEAEQWVLTDQQCESGPSDN
ncbi:MAG: hypothetical protein ABIV21_00120 [Pyrinomonadaceae bacterium]